MPPEPSDFLPTSPIEEARKHARSLRAAVDAKNESKVRGNATHGRLLANKYAETRQPDAEHWAKLAKMFGDVHAIGTSKDWTKIERLTRAIEKSVGAVTNAVDNANTLGALSELSTKAREQGGITAIMEKGLKGKSVPPDVSGKVMSYLSGAPPVQSPAAHQSAANVNAGIVGGPRGTLGPGGRRGKKSRKTRRGKKRGTRRR